MRLAWMTDIHLNFLGTQQIEAVLQRLTTQKLDALLITGDIGEAPNVTIFLTRIADHLQIPIYFVLGNHDYYHSSIQTVRGLMQQIHETHEGLHWLPQSEVIQLNSTTSLMGHGGWGDGRYGDFMRSTLMLNDYILIEELSGIDPVTRLRRLVALGEEAGHYLRRQLPNALEHAEHIYVAMHVPPFQESAWHEGQTPDDDHPYLPHFTCKAAGDALLEIAAQFPNKQITVLCGHTHGSGTSYIRDNLTVITAGAEYGKPRIEQVFSF